MHGLLERMGKPLPASVIEGDWWSADPSQGQGLTGSVRLSSGARWDSAWIQLLAMSDYDERIRLYFDDEVKTLEIPSPWLRQSPTRYTSSRSGKDGRASRTFESYEESYERELVHFHDWSLAASRAAPRRSRRDWNRGADRHVPTRRGALRCESSRMRRDARCCDLELTAGWLTRRLDHTSSRRPMCDRRCALPEAR